MKWHRVLLATSGGFGLVLAAVAWAGAQSSSPLPGASEVLFGTADSGAGGTSVQMSEPDGGFLGACLVPFLLYAPQLPTVCYTPSGATYLGQPGYTGPTTVTFPASDVAFSYSPVANQDSYQSVMTCVPHLSAPQSSCATWAGQGTCPCGTFPISQSCCDYGMHMVSVDGAHAQGVVAFTLNGGGAVGASTADGGP
jgi:hypothetical protein